MIKYLKLKKLDSEEIKKVIEITEKEFRIIKRDFKNPLLIVNIHKQRRIGKDKYSIKLKLEEPRIHQGNMMVAKQFDWDLVKALHKTFDNLKNEIRHKIGKEEIRKKKKRFWR